MTGEFGKYLKERREAVGLSQQDVAVRFHYSTPQFISNWERGLSYPPVATLKALAALYKLNANDLYSAFESSYVERTKADLIRQFKTRK